MKAANNSRPIGSPDHRPEIKHQPPQRQPEYRIGAFFFLAAIIWFNQRMCEFRMAT